MTLTKVEHDRISS